MVSALRRSDKYQLSGGKLIYAPRYPRWLESPGFWDEVHYHDEVIRPVFTYSILDKHGIPIPLRFSRRSWWPGRSVSFYRSSPLLNVNETRLISPDDQVVSILSVLNKSAHSREFDLVIWTCQSHKKELPHIENIQGSTEAISFSKIQQGRRSVFSTCWEIGSDRTADSYIVVYGEPTGLNPVWKDTVFATSWSGKLSDEVIFNNSYPWGTVWGAMHFHVRIPAGAIEEITLFARITENSDAKGAPRKAADILERNHESWDQFFEGVPDFRCSEPLWERLYRHRWYLIRQNLKSGAIERMPHDGVCEGPDFFHHPISYSMPPIIFDLRWHRDSTLAKQQLLNFCERQEDSGRLPGALFHDQSREEFFYHADWGRALERIHELHPDREFLAKVYPPLCRYGEWLLRERDAEQSGMIDIINMMETGQEFNSRYIPSKEEFDHDAWIETKPMKGVDSTVYGLFLWEALAGLAEELGKEEDKRKWLKEAEKTRDAITNRMWQPDEKVFSDLVPGEGMRPTNVRVLTNFYPFLSDLITNEHLETLRDSLLSPEEFWTKVPTATLSQKDPHFNADGMWRGMVRNCPWNGRIWPMTESHVVEILAEASKLDSSLRTFCAEILRSFAEIFRSEGNVKNLSSYEHYHPFNGSPCTYRGIDDYLHCWVIDLIIRLVAGFRLEDDSILIDPFPLGIERINLTGVPCRGSSYDLRIRDGEARLRRDGKTVGKGKIPLRINI